MDSETAGKRRGYDRRLSALMARAIAALAAIAVCAAPQAAAARQKRARKPVSTISGFVTGAPKVKVTVVGAGMSTRTNSSGFFSLSGKRLSGSHTLKFKNGKKSFTTTVNVPPGSRVSLQNVGLHEDGSADPDEEDVEVKGILSAVDCNAAPNTLTITPGDGGAALTMSFDAAVAHIIDEASDTAITDCATLAGFVNAPAKAEGMRNGSGGIDATEVGVNPSEDEHDSEVSFHGVVQSANCPASIAVQRSDGTVVTVNIADSTKIELEDSDKQFSAACSDIPVGANVKVEGAAQPDGSVNAAKIEVRENEFESEGTINSTNCAATPPSLDFTPEHEGGSVTVTIGDTTVIKVGDNHNAACGDLAPGDAEIRGVTQPDGTVAARRIEQEGSEGGGGDD
jgi:hypothetical protein